MTEWVPRWLKYKEASLNEKQSQKKLSGITHPYFDAIKTVFHIFITQQNTYASRLQSHRVVTEKASLMETSKPNYSQVDLNVHNKLHGISIRLMCLFWMHLSHGKGKARFKRRQLLITWMKRENTQQVKGNSRRHKTMKCGWMLLSSQPGCWHTNVPGSVTVMILLRNAR